MGGTILDALFTKNDEEEKHQDWQHTKLGEVFKFTKKPNQVRYSDYEYIPFIPMEAIPIGQLFFNQFNLRNGLSI